MNTNSKTDSYKSSDAYNIRLSILKLAHDDCFDVFYRKIDSAKDTTENGLTEEYINSIYPSTDNIIKRAEELYKFVYNNK